LYVTRMVPVMSRRDRNRNHLGFMVVSILWVSVMLAASDCRIAEALDVVSGVIESPRLKGKRPFEKLLSAAELLKEKKLKHSDLVFLLLDWTDRYIREPSDPLARLKRWAQITNDERLSQLRLPRDLLNRVLLAEYLVRETPYLKSQPRKRLELLAELSRQKLVDWSVFLAYARLYAGDVINGATQYENPTPIQALKTLKSLKDDGLIGWHYRVPTEAILSAEALALDKKYRQGTPLQQLEKLRELEQAGLVTALTRKDLEKLPAWRLLMADKSFLNAGPKQKKKRLLYLKDKGLILASTYSDLVQIFQPFPAASLPQSRPAPLPGRMPQPNGTNQPTN
jgi:hypothetical protein